MTAYTHLLVAVDLTEESAHVLEQASLIAKAFGARMSLVHVLEPLSFAYGGDIPMDLTQLQEQLAEEAKKQLSRLADTYHVMADHQYVLLGHTQTEVHRVAQDNQVDLIVSGSHGRHGLALLLGSTSNAILHGANCDVLAVRVGKT
jgi:universal stress protein A